MTASAASMARIETEIPGNRQFLVDLLLSLVALGLSAVFIVAIFIWQSPPLGLYWDTPDPAEVQPRVFPPQGMVARLGAGAAQEGRYQFKQLAADGSALVTSKTSLESADYQFVRVELDNRQPGQQVFLVWRTAQEQGGMMSAELYWGESDAMVLRMAGRPGWTGRIIEIGVGVQGTLGDPPLSIGEISLLPASIGSVLHAVWSEWTVYAGWSYVSINTVWGTREASIASPTVATACWAGLALLLLFAIALVTKRHRPLACVCAIVVPWISLDMLWQNQLDDRLQTTRFQFGGKSQHEKHLVEPASELYTYAQYLKQEVLPAAGPRIFLLHDSEPMTYIRLRAQYFLLPHNIYNYYRYPNAGASRPGDYVLVLGAIPGLFFDQQQGTLNWSGEALRVRIVNNQGPGTLYQVMNSDD